MYIANPMYDTVFKFLLEDNALARLLIGTIIQEEILTLDFRPQERTSEIDTHDTRFLTVYRLDFAARIRNAAGEERQVLIELQKAKYATDIMRFRRYLGSQYRDPDNTQLVELGQDKSRSVRQGLPLLTIYFLGHTLEYTDAPVIQVRRESRDLTTGEPLPAKEPFIESLTHDSYVIQVPRLQRGQRTEVEQMLQLFDQGRTRDDRHILEIDETEIPERYRPLVRRLQQAMAEPKIADAMELEDEILAEMQQYERTIERERVRANQAQAQAEQAQAQAEQAQAQTEQAQAQAEQAQAQAEQERAEKDRLLALLKQQGIDPTG